MILIALKLALISLVILIIFVILYCLAVYDMNKEDREMREKLSERDYWRWRHGGID